MDIDPIGVKLSGYHSRMAQQVSGIFDITGAAGDQDTVSIGRPYYQEEHTFSDIHGFTPGQDEAYYAKAYFYVADRECDRWEWVAIELGNSVMYREVDVDILGMRARVLTELNENGTVAYTVTSLRGDFWLDYARIDVCAREGIEPQGEPLADGGTTLLLLGLAVSGMAFFRRK